MQAAKARSLGRQEMTRHAAAQLTSDSPEAVDRMLTEFQPADTLVDSGCADFLTSFVPLVKQEAMRLFSQPRVAVKRSTANGAAPDSVGGDDTQACAAPSGCHLICCAL